MKLYLKVLLFFLCLASNVYAQNTQQQIAPNRFNSAAQQKKPYLIYISADGFRFDYAEKYHAKNILALSEKGVQAEALIPAFPTLTFPNHYTLATGMYPAHHGIVNNTFYNPKTNQFYTKTSYDSTWYGGTPIWTLAEQNQLLAATYFWIGSESILHGLRPSYWYKYQIENNLEKRIEVVKDWLLLPADRRPHLIAFYLPEVDMAAHAFGAESEEVAKAVQLVDRTVGKMVAMSDSLNLPVNYVFVSDHGLIDVDRTNYLTLPSKLDLTKFIIPDGNAILQLYAKDKSAIDPAYQILKNEAKDYDVYLANETPKKWHFRSSDNPDGRVGDIILVARAPKVFKISAKPITKGKHGFDTSIAQMQAVFYAWGPAFKTGIKLKPFENIHIYPLLAQILGLPLPLSIDGKLEVIADILK